MTEGEGRWAAERRLDARRRADFPAAANYLGVGSMIITHGAVNRVSRCCGEKVAQTAGKAIAATRNR
jgi:hypothetical protein